MVETKDWNKFCQNNPPPINTFNLGHLVEARDSRARSKAQLMTSHSRLNTANTPRVSLPAEFTLGKVVAIQGPRLCVHMLGTDDMHDQWFLCDSEDIRPHFVEHNLLDGQETVPMIGDCDSRSDITRRYLNSPLHPPQAFRGDPAHYKRFISRYDLKNISAPVKIYQRPPKAPSKNLFQVGEKIEAVDLSYPAYICPATVREITGNYLRVGFDGWREGFDYWTRYDSRDIFPAGWCEFVGHELQSPGAHEQSMLRKQRCSAPPPDTNTPDHHQHVITITSTASPNNTRPETSPRLEETSVSDFRIVNKRCGPSFRNPTSSGKSSKKKTSRSPIINKKRKIPATPSRTLRSHNIEHLKNDAMPGDDNEFDDYEECKTKKPLSLASLNCVVAITPAKHPNLSLNYPPHPPENFKSKNVTMPITQSQIKLSCEENSSSAVENESVIGKLSHLDFVNKEKSQSVLSPDLPTTQTLTRKKNKEFSWHSLAQSTACLASLTVGINKAITATSNSITSDFGAAHFILKDGNLLPNDPVTWSTADVFRYLSDRDAGLIQTAMTLKEAEVDGISFLLLKMCNMTKHLNLKLGPALKLNHMIEELSRFASEILPDFDFSQ